MINKAKNRMNKNVFVNHQFTLINKVINKANYINTKKSFVL
jgi:hypothetical protein